MKNAAIFGGNLGGCEVAGLAVNQSVVGPGEGGVRCGTAHGATTGVWLVTYFYCKEGLFKQTLPDKPSFVKSGGATAPPPSKQNNKKRCLPEWAVQKWGLGWARAKTSEILPKYGEQKRNQNGGH